MLVVFIRVVVLYLFSVLAMRLMGKRQVGQLQPYELVLALMVAEIAAAPMENMGTPLVYGLVPILGLLVLHGVCTALAIECMPVRRLLFGKPGTVIRQGKMDIKQMRRMGYTVEDLTEELRGLGYGDVSEIEAAVLETNGRLSAFPKAAYAPLTPEDMGMAVQEKGLPRLLLVEGKVQKKELQESGRDMRWLQKQLEKAEIGQMKDVMLMSLDGQGNVFLQKRSGGAPLYYAAKGEE